MSRNTTFLNVLYIISFIDLLAVGTIFGLLHNQIRTIGGSYFIVGFCSSIYSGLQVFSGPIIGSWCDVRGLKQVLRISLWICIPTYLCLGLAQSISVIILLRVILGTIKHTQTISKAMIAELLPQQIHAKAFGRQSTISVTAFVIAPVIGGQISELEDGFFLACCFTSMLMVINLVLTALLPDFQKENQTDNALISFKLKEELSKTIKNLTEVNWRIYGPVFLLRFLFGVSTTTFITNQSIYAQKQFSLTQKQTSYSVSLLSFLGAIAGLTISPLSKKFYPNDVNYKKRLLHFFILLSTTNFLLFMAPNVLVYIMLLVPYGYVSLVLRILTMQVVLLMPETGKAGSLTGASNSVMSIARFVSPMVSGIVGDVFGEGAVLVFAGVPALVAGMVCVGFEDGVVKKKLE